MPKTRFFTDLASSNCGPLLLAGYASGMLAICRNGVKKIVVRIG
jgi:hypothetical protein